MGLYLRLRDRYAAPLLLESSDYQSRENSYSFLCFEPLASFTATPTVLQFQTAEATERLPLPETNLPEAVKNFVQRFRIEGEAEIVEQAGFFGHTNFDAVRHFETIDLSTDKPASDVDLPDMHYGFYRFVIVINHFNDALSLIEYRPQGEASRLDEMEAQVRNRGISQHDFQRVGEETASGTEEEFKELVSKGKAYCQAGEVFQVVFSRRFSQSFSGDEFNVYRALRSINPSPY